MTPSERIVFICPQRVGALVALLGMLLSSCAAPRPAPLPKYVAPATGPTAKLVMRGSVAVGDVYGVLVHDDAENCKGPRLAGTGNISRNPVSTTLTANQLTTLEFLLVKPNKQICDIKWSFKPAEGKTYLVSGTALANSCGARLLDASNPDNIKVEGSALRRTAPGYACVPLALAKPASSAASDAAQSNGDAVLRPGADTVDLQGLIGQ